MKIQLTPVTCYEIRGVDGTTATFVRGEQWHGFTELRHPKLGTLIVQFGPGFVTRAGACHAARRSRRHARGHRVMD